MSYYDVSVYMFTAGGLVLVVGLFGYLVSKTEFRKKR
jgi:hypothetical protein